MLRALASTVTALCLLASCTPEKSATAFIEAACRDDLRKAGARCGSVLAPEDYSRSGGRNLALNIIVLPAQQDDGVHDAHFELEGGPGYAVTDVIDFYVGPGAAYRRKRDLVFIDMRGTGASNPLRCPGIETLEDSDPWAPMYPPDLVARCAADLASRADLSQYTTLNASRDLETVRAALGYSQVSLFGLSYGTSLALAYIAEYPDRVRSAVLMGAVPPEAMPPRYHAQNAASALTSLIASCRSDSACAARYPHIEADFAQALEKLSVGPDRPQIFAEWIRNSMYTPAGARRVPLLVERAAQGDVSAVGAGGGPPRVFADGLYLSITCTESFPRFDVEQASAEARATPFGDYRLRRQSAACGQWPVSPANLPALKGPLPPAVLFVSGEFDPVTPPVWADRASRHFPNSRHIVLQGSGHVFDGMSGLETCLDPLMLAFLDSGDASKLDVSCIADVQSPVFALD